MPITRDQAATLFAAGGTTAAITWPSNPAAGSKVIVSFSFPGAVTVTSVTDNGTTPSTFTADSGPGSGSNKLYIYRADNITQPASGSYTVTVTFSGASGGATGWGQSYLGAAAGGPSSSNAGTGTSTSVSSSAATPAGAGALFFSAFNDASGLNPETITLTGSGFTQGAVETNGASFACGAWADKIDAAGPTATACTWTLGDSVGWSAAIVAYDAASPGAGAVLAWPGRTWLRRFHHRQAPQQAQAAAASAVPLAESGAADDSSLAVTATVPLAEAGSGADALAVAAAVPLAETGTAADTLAVAAAVPLADAGSGAETLATGSPVSLAETGTGADTLSVSAAVPLAETGAGADALAGSAAVPFAESGAAADATAVTAAVPLPEAGAALDMLSAAAVLPFTVGTLSASGAPASTLTAAGASSTLTAATAAQAALTAADQRTGGPGG